MHIHKGAGAVGNIAQNQSGKGHFKAAESQSKSGGLAGSASSILWHLLVQYQNSQRRLDPAEITPEYPPCQSSVLNMIRYLLA